MASSSIRNRYRFVSTERLFGTEIMIRSIHRETEIERVKFEGESEGKCGRFGNTERAVNGCFVSKNVKTVLFVLAGFEKEKLNIFIHVYGFSSLSFYTDFGQLIHISLPHIRRDFKIDFHVLVFEIKLFYSEIIYCSPYKLNSINKGMSEDNCY